MILPVQLEATRNAKERNVTLDTIDSPIMCLGNPQPLVIEQTVLNVSHLFS